MIVYVTQQLAEAAASVDSSLQQLSEIQVATHPDVNIGTPENAKTLGMTQITSINWTGPIEPLLQHIATMSHYTLHIVGNPPAIPVLINLNKKNEVLATILRNITYQAAKQATITTYPKKHVIELRYHAY